MLVVQMLQTDCMDYGYNANTARREPKINILSDYVQCST